MISPQENVSPFDVNMACDAGYDLVIPYTNVNLTDVKALVQDAIFSRSVSNAKKTGVFICGKDASLALDMMDAAKKAMVPPFEISVFPDPAGSFTTAAAMVACTEKTLKEKFNTNFENKNIIVYGESLGTAVAIDLAKDHKFAGVILESPFTSMLKLSRKYYPWAPTGLLLKDKYETDKKINKVFSPILILHGRNDNIVPFEMGESLFKQANKPKYNYFIDNDDHMMDFNEALVNSINQFIKNLN